MSGDIGPEWQQILSHITCDHKNSLIRHPLKHSIRMILKPNLDFGSVKFSCLTYHMGIFAGYYSAHFLCTAAVKQKRSLKHFVFNR